MTGPTAGAGSSLRATSTTASAWRRQKSRQAGIRPVGGLPRPAAPGRGRARPAPGRRGRPRPGSTTHRCWRSRVPSASPHGSDLLRRAARPARRRRPPTPARAAARAAPPPPAVRSRSATWPSTNRAADGSVASTSSNAARGISTSGRVAAGPHRGRALLTGEQRQLAQHLSRAELAHHGAADLHLEPAGAHDVRRPRRVALADQPPPGRQVDDAGRAPPAGCGPPSGSTRDSGSSDRSTASAAPSAAGTAHSAGGVRCEHDRRPVVVDVLLRRGGPEPAQRQGDHGHDHERDDRQHPAVVQRRRPPSPASGRRGSPRARRSRARRRAGGRSTPRRTRWRSGPRGRRPARRCRAAAASRRRRCR